ncbi:hypothetical protein M407DRAFT_7585 [Tulasnella calospora MUT 4182]|uniref:Uncharacterized protein n=1 Tax=Tulasnella calospora MUT 4182 TaxID=1051891 RepID=A0A0C3Q9X1_9AGAM|nr:hypothetical protein M407DRAFT_7585 [Tulasnella calospora MUT 4182]
MTSRLNRRHHHSPSSTEPPLPVPPHAPPLYNPPPARPYTATEIRKKANRLNHITFLSARADHEINAVLEYPETTADASKLAHVFKVDPNAFRDPSHNIQYSFQVTGGAEDLKCQLLQVENGDGLPVAANCYKIRGQCCGVKLCNFASVTQPLPSHTSVDLNAGPLWSSPTPRFTAKQEVFEKTLALFCSIKVDGCHASVVGETTGQQRTTTDTEEEAYSSTQPVDFTAMENTLVQLLSHHGHGTTSGNASSTANGAEDPNSEDDGELDAEGEVEVDERLLYRPSRSRRGLTCPGVINLRVGKKTGKSYLCCDRLKDGPGHFLYTSLHEVDIRYLQALLDNDTAIIDEIELEACRLGYGPRATCTYMTEHRRVGDFCAKEVTVETYPYAVLVTSRPHNHPPPRRSKTPPVHVDIVRTLLVEEDWRLADATPRRLSLNKSFVSRLKAVLQWQSVREPVLSDLHPSLANQQKVNYIIKCTKELQFTAGTDWEGARLLHEDQAQRLDPEDQYLRCVEEIKITTNESIRIAVCMFPAQSRLLSKARWITCDTSYKRVKRSQEFGIEGWDETTHRSISYCRVFITSESAEAHRILFHKISAIVTQDTGTPLQFLYIHGQGIEVITADEGKGQALGLGLFLKDICGNNFDFDPAEPTRRFCELGPYEHLARLLRLCTVHFQRNIKKIEGRIHPDTKIEGRIHPDTVAAMYSLASSQPLADLEGTLQLIRRSGRDAQNWLYDKEVSSPFALPALYQPRSRIPLERWLAARSTTNGIEQTHHNYNIDGINLTLLGGIMHGFQYDARALSRQDLAVSTLILPTYTSSNHYNRTQTALRRQAKSIQKRGASRQNDEDPTLISPARKRPAGKK